MTAELIAYLVLMVALLVLVAFFSGTETAFTSVNRLEIDTKAASGDHSAKTIKKFLEDFENFLSTVLTGTNLVNVTLVTVAGVFMNKFILAKFFPNLPKSSYETVTAIILTPIILVLGEILPKSIARQQARSFSLHAARPLAIFNTLLSPLVITLTWLSRQIQKLLKLDSATLSDNAAGHVTKEDLEAIAEIAAEQEMVPQEAADMLQMVLELDEKPVSESMTPLVEVCSLPASATVQELEEKTVATGFSRFPVFKDRVDNIIGVVSLRRILNANPNLDESSFKKLRIAGYIDTNVLFIPETKPINQLLVELQRHEVPMSIVIDEYGGMIGIATIEDLIQQIVGSLQDFGEQDEQPILNSENEMLCDGRTLIRDIEDFFNLDIDQEGFETIAGLILKLAGHIPLQGETFTYQDLQITVLATENHRISRLKIKRMK